MTYSGGNRVQRPFMKEGSCYCQAQETRPMATSEGRKGGRKEGFDPALCMGAPGSHGRASYFPMSGNVRSEVRESWLYVVVWR